MHSLVVPTSPQRDRAVVAGWIAGAVARREKVLYRYTPTDDAATVLRRSLPGAGLDPAVLGSGQVRLADTTVLRAETGGRHDALYALHLEQLRQATWEGFAGLALVGDAAAMRSITRDNVELAGYERDLERLAAEVGVRSLCRYPPDEEPGLLDEILAVHYRDVADDGWSVEVTGDRLRVRGEIDFLNADRLVPVLRAAMPAGVRSVDATEVEFCDVAGVRALVSATDAVPPEARPMPVVVADGLLAQLLTLTGARDRGVLQVVEPETGG